MCCWTRNSLLIEHKYETGEEVAYQDRKVLVTEVFPVETGLADYSVFMDGKTVRVNENALSPAEVYEFVDR